MELNRLVNCHDCDAIQCVGPLRAGAVARCMCCGARLFGNPRGGLDMPLALSVCSMILLSIANSFPFLSLNLQGNIQTTTLTGASWAFVKNDQIFLAFVVWFSTVIVPSIVISGLCYVLIALRFGIKWPHIRSMLHILHRLQPWGMMDVFMLGVLVALVKLSSLAEINLGVGLYAFIFLIVFFAGAMATLEPHLLWERVEHNG